MDYKIEQAILRLKKNIEQNNKHDLIKFENEFLRINENRSEAIWVILSYLIFLILIPIVFLIYFIIFEKDYYWLIGLFIFIPTTFILEFKKMIIGSTTLEINFTEEYFGIKNNTILFKSLLKPKVINFKEIVRSKLDEKTVFYEYSKPSRWQQLSVIDKNEKKHILTDFDCTDNTIAKEVKHIIDTIISNSKD